MSALAPPRHNRIVLLFDLDCFYAQCERVRLGLDVGVSLALLQWNSVLAVTYPAREFGIKRGDSWDDVAQKSNEKCWAIHLQILEMTKCKNDAEEQQQEEQEKEDFFNLEQAYNQVYKLSEEEQLECQKKERGVRRLNHEGKACLERYRIASMRIFSVVLESLTKRLGGKDQFIYERASIDEFYLDVTTYCYNHQTGTEAQSNDNPHKTVVVGASDKSSDSDPIQHALERACQVSHWIRTDVWDVLGFTMSAGISTNKTMAKLAASYGKPKGQAVLHPNSFAYLMAQTKIRKVRNFGGKLGKKVLDLLRNHHPNLDDEATMADLCQVALPTLQQHFSEETAQFVFHACRGMDREAVKETAGALVKSITAFKSITATANRSAIQNWLNLLASEIVTRVTTDSARYLRYPKSCTLNYNYFITIASEQRPNGSTTQSQRRQSRSIRLQYPAEKDANKKALDLVQQAMDRLAPILQQHPLGGVGISISNFESRGRPPEGVAAIDNFFSKKKKKENEDEGDSASSRQPQQEAHPPRDSLQVRQQRKRKAADIGTFFSQPEETENVEIANISIPAAESRNLNCAEEETDVPTLSSATKETSSSLEQPLTNVSIHENKMPPTSSSSSSVITDKDLELAKKLQASFDRENYIFSTVNRLKDPHKKKVRRIDTFFGKR
jgi:DNA polymerase eta